MRNVVCWDALEVRQIINPFAEHIPDALFRAVHTDLDLKVSAPIGVAFQDLVAAPWSYSTTTPAVFLEDFLRNDRPHALAVVLGTTGSGKSHLIHWMRLNVKEDSGRMVLVVRKSGTSLRAIVEMIIERLPADEQQGFRDTLNRAGESTTTREGQKQQLLNDIATSIREDIVSEGGETAELEAELIRLLPDIFQDPHMRLAHFLSDGTVIADIVDHIFAPSTASDRPDARRSFKEHDLPFGGMDFASASKNARDALQVVDLYGDESRGMTVRIINRNLEKATSRTLSFSGDRVEELMGRLRAHLKTQKRELILLVEEFARLQGIDRALLQAMTNQGDGSYCRMRSAIAVTTGFFESVAETAYMRTTHIVNMDQSSGHRTGGRSDPQDLGRFASRYLNAVRLGRDQIEAWATNAEPGEAAPSKCAICRYRPDCHPTFGQIDGYGLYPFTDIALANASQRVHRNRPENVNPRILQNEVLAEVLDVNEPSIRAGTFPTDQLIEKLGGDPHLDVAARNGLKDADPDAAVRLIPFLELYGAPGSVADLPVGLRDAFGIPALPESVPADKLQPQIPQQIDRPDQRPVREDEHSSAINKWIRGEGLDQNVAQALRESLFAAVSDNIDWDMIGLERSSFVGPSRAFVQRTGIVFERQTTSTATFARVQLAVPGNVDKDKAGQALIGLLRAGRQQFRWDFEHGGAALAAFLDCLAVWTADVERQLRDISSATQQWDPAKAAMELLCIGAAIGGRIKPDSRAGDMLDAALGAWPSECASEAGEMRALYNRLSARRERLMEIARSQLSSMKGGQVGAMLNPRRAYDAVRHIRQRNWRLTLVPPAEERGDYAVLVKTYLDAKSSLDAAIVAELAVRKEWLAEMSETFGEKTAKAAILVGVRELKDASTSAGLAAGGNPVGLSEAIDRFAVVQFDDAVAAARALESLGSDAAHLPYLGRGRRNAIEAGRDLRKTARAFLQSVESNLSRYADQFRAEYGGIEESIRLIDEALTAIQSGLEDLHPQSEGSTDAA